MSKYLTPRNLLMLLAVGFTTLSLMVGYVFYETHFNTHIAILSIVMFEFARLFSITIAIKDKLTKKNAVRKSLMFLTYGILVLICSSATSTSLETLIHENTLEDSFTYRQEIERRIHLVQKAYSEYYDNKLLRVEKDLDQAKFSLAKYPYSGKWKKREEQLIDKKVSLYSERDSILSSVPADNKEKWLGYHSAIVGIDFNTLAEKSKGILIMTQTFKELWRIKSTKTAQEIVAIAITFAGEVCIFLLIFYANRYLKPEEIGPKPKREGRKPDNIISNFLNKLNDLNFNNGNDKDNHKEDKQFEDLVTKPTPPVEISETDTIVNTNYSVEEPPEQENPESDESSLFEQPMAESDFSEKVMNSLLAEFEEEKIQRFLEKAAKWFLENGNLIPTNRVSKNLQEIRRFFAQKLSKSEVDLFFSVNLNNSSIQPK